MVMTGEIAENLKLITTSYILNVLAITAAVDSTRNCNTIQCYSHTCTLYIVHVCNQFQALFEIMNSHKQSELEIKLVMLCKCCIVWKSTYTCTCVQYSELMDLYSYAAQQREDCSYWLNLIVICNTSPYLHVHLQTNKLSDSVFTFIFIVQSSF